MKYTLMHKNIFVVDIELDKATGYITKIYELHNHKHLPVGVAIKHNIIDRASLNEWWMNRSIPSSRSGIKLALEALNLSNAKELITRSFGLSLSDQYWIQPYNIDITWDDVNFFDNSFSEDIGDVLFDKTIKNDDFDFNSPDNTTDGCLKKHWKIINGECYLIKGGSNPYIQQPFNEVIASKIMECLNINYIPYSIVWDNDNPYSICKNFITVDTELVSAYRVMKTQKCSNDTSIYQHYVNCCENLGVRNIIHSLDEMIVLDYIIANEDRHLNNFGLIRNANTLEWIGTAPIFDSGSSLGFDETTRGILSGKIAECKPFRSKHDKQLKLVTSFDWLQFDKLKNIRNIIADTFNKSNGLIDGERLNAIIISTETRIDNIEQAALRKNKIFGFMK